jgi:hypothetical protein
MNLYNEAVAEEFPELASRYWSGEMTAKPIPEVLLKLPVSLIEPVPGNTASANQSQPDS